MKWILFLPDKSWVLYEVDQLEGTAIASSINGPKTFGWGEVGFDSNSLALWRKYGYHPEPIGEFNEDKLIEAKARIL